MRIYFDIIFVVLNVILFALNFHFYKHENLESAENEAKRLATLLKKKAYVLCTIKSIEDTQYKIEDCRPNGSDLPF